MKRFIKTRIKEFLTELKTIEKPQYGKGTQHRIYASLQHPDRLFKIGDKKTVLFWLTIFKKYPNFFPKVFRSGEQKDNKYYVEVEKLNTELVITEWQQLTDTLEEIGAVDTDINDDVDRVFRESLTDENYGNEILQILRKYNKSSYRIFMKWLNFLYQLNSIIQPIKGKMLDVHRGNFGYDSSNNMKCLDI
jgi:hypothetical protein